MIRKYEKDVKKAASIIAAEVVEHGSSTGWTSSDFGFFIQLKAYLTKFNIAYVDDFAGEWAYRKS